MKLKEKEKDLIEAIRNFRQSLFMMSKIQNLNGTHNPPKDKGNDRAVVYDVKDTKFEWNSQLENKGQIEGLRCL